MSLETELRDRFSTAADSLPEPDLRLDAVVRRGTRRRRTSQLVTALAVVAVVGGGVALLDTGLGGRAAPVVGTPGGGTAGDGTPADGAVDPQPAALTSEFDDVIWPVVWADEPAVGGWQADPAEVARNFVQVVLGLEAGSAARGESTDVVGDRATYEVATPSVPVRVALVRLDEPVRWYVTGADTYDEVTFEATRSREGLFEVTGTGARDGGLTVGVLVQHVDMAGREANVASFVDETAGDGSFRSGPFGSPHRTDLPAVVAVVLMDGSGSTVSVHTTKLAGSPDATPSPTAFDERYRWVIWPAIAAEAAAEGHRPQGFQGGSAATPEAFVEDRFPSMAAVTAMPGPPEADGDGVWALVEMVDLDDRRRTVAVLVEEIDGTYWVLHAQDRADVTVDVARGEGDLVVTGAAPVGDEVSVTVEAVTDGTTHVLGASAAVLDGTYSATVPIDGDIGGTARVTVEGRTAGTHAFVIVAARDVSPGTMVRGPIEDLPDPVADALPGSGGTVNPYVVWLLVLAGILAPMTFVVLRRQRRRNRAFGRHHHQGTSPTGAGAEGEAGGMAINANRNFQNGSAL